MENMKYLIVNNEIAAFVREGEEPPGAVIKEGPFALTLGQLYLDDGLVKRKPAPPSIWAWWDNDSNEWQEPPLPVEALPPDWEGFAAALRGGPIWAKFYAAGAQDLRSNQAGTVLLNTITASQNLNDLAFALAEILAAMAAADGVETLTQSEKEALDVLLIEHRLKV